MQDTLAKAALSKESLQQFMSQENYNSFGRSMQSKQPVQPNNMDSLEPDSMQPSTAKQLSRVQNQQISNGPPQQQLKMSKSNFLQRNLTEVGPPGHYAHQKNNFFTEPDEGSVQAPQPMLMQSSQHYGMMGDSQEHQDSIASASHMQYLHNNGALSLDRQIGPNGQILNLVVSDNYPKQDGLAQHYNSNPAKPAKESTKMSSAKSNQAQSLAHHHQRTAASHFATQDNRQMHQLGPHQKSTGQLSQGVP